MPPPDAPGVSNFGILVSGVKFQVAGWGSEFWVPGFGVWASSVGLSGCLVVLPMRPGPHPG